MQTEYTLLNLSFMYCIHENKITTHCFTFCRANYHSTRRLPIKPPVDGVCPTRRRFWLTSNHAPRWWDFPHSGAANKTPMDGVCPTRRRFRYSSTRWWDFSHSEAAMRFSTDGMCPPLGGSRRYTPTWDVPPYKSVNADMRTGLSQSTYGSQTLSCGIFPYSESHSAAGIFPLRKFDLPMMECAPTRRITSVHS